MNMDMFLQNYLRITTTDKIQGTKIYLNLTKEFDNFDYEASINKIKEIHKYGQLFHMIEDPERSALCREDPKLKLLLKRLKDFDTSSIRPLIVKLYILFYENKTDSFYNCLSVIESYIARQKIINMSNTTLNRFILIYLPKLKGNEESPDEFLKSIFLKTESETDKWPDDEQVIDAFKKLTFSPKSFQKIRKYIHTTLRRIEHFISNKESLDLSDTTKYTIEHIMPSTLTPEWKNNLGENCQKIYSEYLNNYGNLTIQL